MAHCEVLGEDYDRVDQVLSSGQLSPGLFCREFEILFAKRYDAKHALFVNSGTDALRLSLLAMKEKYQWPAGSQVAVPAITFVATINVILQAGLEPFFVDVGMNDYNMNPDNLARRLETDVPNLVAMMPVHMFGQQADMPRLMEQAKIHNLRVIEDSCETVGAGPLWGEITCFSTYQAHIVATGIGGLVVTQDDELNEILRSYANHGRDTDYLPGYRTPEPSKELLTKRFRFPRHGYSCRASEFEAAIGIGQLERLDVNLVARRDIAAQLLKSLDIYTDLELPTPVYPRLHSYMMFPIVIKEMSHVAKEDLVWALEQSGIETRDMMPISTQPAFEKYFRGSTYCVSDWINRCGFYIPCHPGMTQGDVNYISCIFDEFLCGVIDKKAFSQHT